MARADNLSLIAKNPGLNRSILLLFNERWDKEESGANILFWKGRVSETFKLLKEKRKSDSQFESEGIQTRQKGQFLK
jgi:hypothetical protein